MNKNKTQKDGPGGADASLTEIWEAGVPPPLKARQATELLAALVEIAIAHGRRHYSKSGEPLATTLAVLECLQREGFITVEAPETP